MSTKIVQAECKSKRSLRFCRGAAYLSGGSSSAKCASRVQKQTCSRFCRGAAYLSGRLVLRKVCMPRVEPEAKKAGIRIVSDPIFRPSNSGNETGDPVKKDRRPYRRDCRRGPAHRREGTRTAGNRRLEIVLHLHAHAVGMVLHAFPVFAAAVKVFGGDAATRGEVIKRYFRRYTGRYDTGRPRNSRASAGYALRNNLPI